MSIESSWIVGSTTTTASYSVTVNGSDYAITAGTRYLRDASASLSWIAQLEAAIQNEVATASVYISQDRKLRIDYDGNNTTLVVPAELRDLYGLTGGSYASAASHTAEDISTLLWSPGWPMTPVGHPAGTSGYTTPQRVVTASPSGQSIYTVQRGTNRVSTTLRASFVVQARAWTTDDGEPGEFRCFQRVVLRPGYRFKHYEEVSESTSSTAAVSWPSTALGPYKMPADQRPGWWDRAVPNADTHTNLEITAIKTAEIT